MDGDKEDNELHVNVGGGEDENHRLVISGDDIYCLHLRVGVLFCVKDMGRSVERVFVVWEMVVYFYYYYIRSLGHHIVDYYKVTKDHDWINYFIYLNRFLIVGASRNTFIILSFITVTENLTSKSF